MNQITERISNVQIAASKGAMGISELTHMLADPSWVVRRAVITALSTLGEPSVKALCEVLKKHRESEAKIAAAVDALVLSNTPLELEIFELANDSNPAVVADMVQIIGRRRSQVGIPILIQMTKHPDDNVAVGAIEALGHVGGRAAVEALIDTVGTGNFFRTFPAINVLGRSSDPRAVEPLVKLLNNPTYLPEAVRALGRSGEKSAVKPLLSLMKSSSDAVIRLVASSLYELRNRYQENSIDESSIDVLIQSHLDPASVRRLTSVLPSADVAEGVAVCKLLGITGNLEATESLTTALDYPKLVAVAAAEALKKIDHDADDPLLKALREGDSSRKKIILPLLTRTSGAPDVVQCLNDLDPEVRGLACGTLARMGSSDSVPDIFKALSDTHLSVVYAATAAIQSLGTRETRLLAAQATQAESPIVRRAGLQILIYLGDQASVELLLKGLEDVDARVRETALQGLPVMEDPRTSEALMTETRNKDPRTRSLAIRALGQMPEINEKISTILLRALSDSDPWVRYYSCQSIGRLGYTEGAREVANLLYDESVLVRVAAVESLSHLDSPEAHESLRRAAVSNNIDMRRASLIGLGLLHRIDDLPLILSAANSSDIPTRLIALSSLSNFNSPLVLQTLGSAGSDRNEQVRSAAMSYLATRKEQEATELLIQLLKNENSRDRAKSALLIPNQNRISGLLIALNSSDDELAPSLISIISKIGLPESRKALLSAMKLNNIAARKAAAVALGSRKDQEMRETLREAAENDPEESVRKICTLLLKD